MYLSFASEVSVFLSWRAVVSGWQVTKCRGRRFKSRRGVFCACFLVLQIGTVGSGDGNGVTLLLERRRFVARGEAPPRSASGAAAGRGRRGAGTSGPRRRRRHGNSNSNANGNGSSTNTRHGRLPSCARTRAHALALHAHSRLRLRARGARVIARRSPTSPSSSTMAPPQTRCALPARADRENRKDHAVDIPSR